MWKWFNCYLSGRHDFGMWCEPGAIFLRCIHCGKRSSGWIVDPESDRSESRTSIPTRPRPRRRWRPRSGATTRVLPFQRAAAR